MFGAGAGEWIALRQAPSGLVVTDIEQERIEMKFACSLSHRNFPENNERTAKRTRLLLQR
jgi:hypothetical protein